ncbi:glycine betaine/L-proline ABC transporter substrate-binding protein ProX [Bosea vaviloviae]|uniref:Glycine betaine ABC transporter substrate-binding protein n=1 Tax=Bosea vaviloviae TaxID=1526658 RepID=A0A1D7TZL1_9HYPH|nr:glycine betaine/L-proline ABC transporter substrate-binding protein ProX [Bosea vaviloviae]AOO80553.1 glycine betaine ABC transporter substrate-binding protein [Bosea vaviloviae]
MAASWTGKTGSIFALACAGFLALSPAGAQSLPGEGRTVRIAVGDTLGATRMHDHILETAFRKLGYKTAETQINPTLFFQAAALGDLDMLSGLNFPQREPQFKTVEKQLATIGDGTIIEGGINGYLIDKKTADANNITQLDQLKDPKIAAALAADGKVNLINCDPGWSCGDVVEYQLDKFGLKNTIKSVRGKYEALMAEAIGRALRGEPTLYYAWSPSWVMDKLVPGKDVVWLPTPFDAVPPNLKVSTSALVSGVKGCAGGQDPCRMALGQWNYMPVANRDFLAKNPAIRRFLELARYPRDTWAKWEGVIAADSSPRAIRAAGDSWIKENQTLFDGWIAEATAAR